MAWGWRIGVHVDVDEPVEPEVEGLLKKDSIVVCFSLFCRDCFRCKCILSPYSSEQSMGGLQLTGEQATL